MIGQIFLKHIERPLKPNTDREICWFCDSLGIDNGRDVNHIAVKIIIALLEQMPENRGIPVEQIADSLDISTSRVNHHIRNLIDNGLVYRHKHRIYIRGSSLCAMVQEIRKDTLRVLSDLELAAADIDASFGIKNR